MDLIERFISEAINVDFKSDSSAYISADYDYNEETEDGKFFGLVCFELESTPIFRTMIDTERKRLGFWRGPEEKYSFFIELNTKTATHVTDRILAVVKSEKALDYYANYAIELDESCHKFIYDTIDKQVQFTLKTTCEDLLKSAQEFADKQNSYRTKISKKFFLKKGLQRNNFVVYYK